MNISFSSNFMVDLSWGTAWTLWVCQESWRFSKIQYRTCRVWHPGVSVAAIAAGCLQNRRRWFFLPRRGKSACAPFADALTPDVPGVSARCPSVSCPAERSGLHFNSGRPDPPRWFAARGEYKFAKDRLCMLGNAVVPQQAIFAAQLLCTEW